MTNRQKFFMNGILLTVVGLAVRTVSLAFNSFVTRSIGAEGMGLFTIICTVYSFAVTFAMSGISLTVTRLTSSVIGEGRAHEARGILRSAVIYSLIFSTFSTLVLFFGAEYFANTVLSDQRATVPLRILAVSLIPIALSSVYSGYFIGVKRVAKNALTQVLAQVFKILITATLVLRYSKIGVVEGVCALSVGITLTELSCFAVAFLQYVIDKKRNLPKTQGKKDSFGAVTGMAVPLAVSAYIRSALITLEHILIPRRLRDGGASDSQALSDYGILHGMSLPMILYPIAALTSFAGLLVPEFAEGKAKGDKNRMNRISSEAINTTLVYSIASMTLVMLFSEELAYVVYDSYEAGKYIFIMAPVIPIMYLDHVSDAMLKGIGEHVYSMWVNIADSFLSIVLVWILIPRLGIGGYALVIMLMELFNFILSVSRLRKRVKIKINVISSIVIPAVSSYTASFLSDKLFLFEGSTATPVWLFLKIIFAVSAFLFIYFSVSAVRGKMKARYS